MKIVKTVRELLYEEIWKIIFEGIYRTYEHDDSLMRKEFNKLLDFAEQNNHIENVPTFMSGYNKIFKINLFQLTERYLVDGLDILLKKPLSEIYQETLEMMPFYLEYNNKKGE